MTQDPQHVVREPLFFDHDIERSLLGRLLLGSNGEPIEIEGIRPFHFHDERNRRVLEATLQLLRAGHPVNPIAVKNLLVETGGLSTIGGHAYLSLLIEDPSPSPDWCIWKLRQFAARRLLERIATEVLTGSCFVGDEEGRRRMKAVRRRLDSLVAHLDEQSAGRHASLRRLDFKKLFADGPAEIPWIVDRWLAPGDVVCLAGEPKTGKSWLALGLSLALATSRPFLDSMKIEGGPFRVLYIDEENNPALIQRRLRRLAHGLGLTLDTFPLARFTYLHQNTLNLDDHRFRSTLFREIRQLKPDWIIFDSLIRFHRRDENSNAAMSEFYGDVLKPIAAHGCGVVLIHHLAKPDRNRTGSLSNRLRGASDILAFVDQFWAVERGSDGAATLRHERSRGAETALPITFRIQDSDRGEGVRLETIDAVSTPEEMILTLLTEAERVGVPRPQVLMALTAQGLKSADKLASKHLKRLLVKGQVLKRQESKIMRYWLTEHAPEDLHETRDRGPCTE